MLCWPRMKLMMVMKSAVMPTTPVASPSNPSIEVDGVYHADDPEPGEERRWNSSEFEIGMLHEEKDARFVEEKGRWRR